MNGIRAKLDRIAGSTGFIPGSRNRISKLKGGVRGKYLARYRAGTNLVLFSPDVAEYFPDEQSVNTALRALIHAAKRPLRRAR